LVHCLYGLIRPGTEGSGKREKRERERTRLRASGREKKERERALFPLFATRKACSHRAAKNGRLRRHNFVCVVTRPFQDAALDKTVCEQGLPFARTAVRIYPCLQPGLIRFV
jgi:hypothetical protein